MESHPHVQLAHSLTRVSTAAAVITKIKKKIIVMIHLWKLFRTNYTNALPDVMMTKKVHLQTLLLQLALALALALRQRTLAFPLHRLSQKANNTSKLSVST